MRVLIEIQPLNKSTGAREAVRVSSAQDRRITGLSGSVWVPALLQPPVLTVRLFDGDFSSAVDPGSATFTINLTEVVKTYPNVADYLWAGAPVSVYAEEPGTAWPWARRFVGKIRRFEKTAKRLQLAAEVDTAALEKDVLYLKYAGTTGLEGGADLKDRPRPWVWGHVKGIEPIQIDIDNSVFQVSGYGPIGGIPALYERGANFGDSVGDHADYAALVAATIPPGRWATCLAQGLFRLGAPPFGVITADVQGHKVGGSVPRRTGFIIRAIAAALGIPNDSIDADSLNALDAAVPRNVNIYLTEQEEFIDLAQRLCLPCNAYSGMSWSGKFFAVRPAFGSSAMTLHGQGRADPQVIDMAEGGVNPPFKKTVFGADRCWRVHTTTDIAYQDILVDRGRYQAGETYRAGNIVDLADGSRWIYTADTASLGNAPAAGSAFWTLISDQVQPVYLDGTTMEELKPAEPGATEGAVIPTPGSGAPGNIKDENGNIRESAQLLNSSLLPTQGGRIGYQGQSGFVEVMRLTPRILDAAEATLEKQLDDNIDNLRRAVVLALSQTNGIRTTLSKAGIYEDPANGQIQISAIDQTRERLNQVSIILDAQAATITTKASVNYVDEQIILAVLNPEQAAELGPLITRLTNAETTISGLQASIVTKASVADLNALGGRVTEAELDIDALQGEITLKVDNTTFDALADRVSSAETQLEAIPDAATITNSVSAARYLQRQIDEKTDANILGLILGDRTRREQVAAIAAARSELGARITEEGQAQTRSVLTLQSRVGAAESQIASEIITRADQFGALGASIFEVNAALTQEIADREGAVEEVNARVTEVEEASVQRDGATRALITREALALRGTQIEADQFKDSVISGLVQADRKSRRDAAQIAFVREEFTSQITDLNRGFSSSLFALGLRIGEAEGSIRELDRVVIENNTTLVQSIDTLTLSTTVLSGTVSTISGDLSSTIGRVDTVEGDLDDTKGRVDEVESGLSGVPTLIEGAITAERVLWQEGDSIIAGDLATLTTTVGENTSTLETFAESIDGLLANYGLKIDINGRITGFGVNASPTATIMRFLMDAVQFIDPTTGDVYLGADASGKLSLRNGTLQMDNGTFMLVIGLGFGVDNDFLLWYGPSRAINLCNRADSSFYIDTTGDGEFGLRLSSNFYKNSGTGTSLADNAQIIVGPFVTDGGVKQIGVTYQYRRLVQITDTFAYTGTPQAVLRVERQVGSGGYTTVGDYTFNGTASGEDGFGPSEPGSALIEINGGASFTDTTAGTGDFTYRVSIISRSVGGLTSTVSLEDELRQQVTLISTEQIT